VPKSRQRRAAIWILGAFKTSSTGAVESLAGLIPIHLQIRKLVYRNYVRMHTLADTHIMRRVAADENQTDNVVYLPSKLSKKAKSPLIDMWRHEKLVLVDVFPFNEFNAPGNRLLDRFPDRVIYDITLIEGKNAKERAKAREVRLASLNEMFDYSSKSDKCAVLVTDASVPLLSTGKQAVAA